MATIIFDFDDTIFDTKRLKKDIFGQLSNHGVKKTLIEKSYKKCRGNYCPFKHIKIIEKNNLKIPKSFHDWLTNFDFKYYLLPKATKYLKKLSKNHYLILLTKGDFEFQEKKIKGSKISKYFKEIHITKKAKEEFLKKKKYPHPIYFVNDKELENKKIKKAFPKIIIKQKKEGEALSALSF